MGCNWPTISSNLSEDFKMISLSNGGAVVDSSDCFLDLPTRHSFSIKNGLQRTVQRERVALRHRKAKPKTQNITFQARQ
jgi:hypothetical protein